MPLPAIRTVDRQCEVAWFSALCSDDYEFLGVPDGALRSNYEHCGDIVRRADALGYQNILLPSGWIVGQDALTFAAAMAPQTKQINQLVALRMGEVWPPMLARAIATVDHISKGRLCLNIISSDMPGTKESNETRYERSSEIIQILRALWRTDRPCDWQGKSNNDRWTAKARGCCARMSCAPRAKICISRTTCGAGLGWRAVVVAAPLSAIPIKCWPS